MGGLWYSLLGPEGGTRSRAYPRSIPRNIQGPFGVGFGLYYSQDSSTPEPLFSASSYHLNPSHLLFGLSGSSVGSRKSRDLGVRLMGVHSLTPQLSSCVTVMKVLISQGLVSHLWTQPVTSECKVLLCGPCIAHGLRMGSSVPLGLRTLPLLSGFIFPGLVPPGQLCLTCSFAQEINRKIFRLRQKGTLLWSRNV